MTAPDSIDPTGWLDDQLASASPDLLRNMVKTFADAVMSAEADQLCGADYGTRSPERTNSRNGYRTRDWDTRAGTVELAIPKLRSGQLLPGLAAATPPPRRTSPGHRGRDQLSAGRLDPAGGETGRAARREKPVEIAGQ